VEAEVSSGLLFSAYHLLSAGLPGNSKVILLAKRSIESPQRTSKTNRRNDMEPRIDYLKVGRGVYEAMLGLEKYLRQCGLDETLLDLIKLRVSQINGCAYCLDMHWKDLRARGESEQRLYGLDAWEESPYYNERERAALAWAEAVTDIKETHAPDDVYEKTRRHFNEKEVADLTLAVAAINSWNRLAIAARSVPGKYQPPRELHKSA
jgi:AhpD family alkylhydroperoxidase